MNLKKINLYSQLKNFTVDNKISKYRNLWHQAAAYEILTNFPLHLDIELSGICNLKCADCFQDNMIKEPLGLMDFDVFKRIIDEGSNKGLCAIKLQIRGESFLHPKLFDCISYAKDNGVLDVQITTNATLLNDENIEKVLYSKLDAIIFSVDSHHKHSYLDKNKMNNYSAVEHNIKKLLAQKRMNDKKLPWVRLRSSIEKCDLKSFQDTKEYLKRNFPGADIYIVGKIHNFRNDKESYPNLHKDYDLKACSHLMQRLSIFWNGDVTTCCMDFNNTFKLGNIKDQSIEDIWLSSKIHNFRTIHYEQNRLKMPICNNCHVCVQLKNENEVYDSTLRHLADY